MVRIITNLPSLAVFDHNTQDATNTQCSLWGSVRLTYSICAFLSNVLQMSMRNMLSLVILRMVKARPEDALLHSNVNDLKNLNATSNCGSGGMQDVSFDQSGDLPWTRNQELTFPGTFYYGFVIALPLAGHLCDRFGGKTLFIYSLTLQAMTYIALPQLAQYSYIAAVTILVISGLFAGCGTPALYQLFVVWAHPTERTAMLSFAYSGVIIGSICIYPLANFLSDFGWQVPFYVLGGVTLVYSIICNWLIYNTLDEHPRLSNAERVYLQPAKEAQLSTKLSIPWKSLLTSVPTYAFVLTHVFHNYGFLVIAQVMPRFMHEAMQFDMNEIGFLSTAPFLGCLVSKIICILSCSFVERKLLGTHTGLRRVLYTVCGIASIVVCAVIILAGCEQKILVLLMYALLGATTDLGFSGGYWPTLLYFAPSYAGLLSGLSNCFAHISGFLAPYIISALVHTGIKAEWNYVILTLIVFNALAIVVFGFYGSTKLEPWDPRNQNTTTPCNATSSMPKTQSL